MRNLNGHEAGNGGNSQEESKVDILLPGSRRGMTCEGMSDGSHRCMSVSNESEAS